MARGGCTGVARGVGLAAGATVRTTGGATRGVALGVGVGVGVGARGVPGRLKCSSPGMVCCGAALCADAAPEAASSDVSVSARMIEIAEIPTNAPLGSKLDHHNGRDRPQQVAGKERSADA